MEKLGNTYLGADFSISGIILLTSIFIFIIYFRKRVFFFLYKKDNLDQFIIDVKEYLASSYPNFKFDYLFIHGLDEKNPDAKKYLILDTLISQYTNKPYKAKVTNPLKTTLWSSYVFYSKANNDKLPEDWMQRKNAILERENQKCQRCSKKINLKQSDIYLIKDIKNGGTFYLENLILLCHDCMKIESKKKDPSIDTKNLDIKDNLYTFIH